MSMLRPFLVCSLAALAACTSVGRPAASAQEWRDLQRQRVRALVRSELAPPVLRADDAPRADAAATPAAAATAPAPQDPRPYLDQRTPPRRRPLQSASADEPYVASLGVGAGSLRVGANGTRFDDTEAAVAAFAEIEPVDAVDLGPGMRFEWIGTGDGMFDSELMNDGQLVRRAGARAVGFDAFPHLRWQVHREPGLTVPLRIGGFVDDLRVQHASADVRRRWFGYGARVELEPTWRLTETDGLRLDLLGLIGGDVGGSRFRENYVGGSDADTVRRLMGELGAGLRLTTDGFVGEIGYRFRTIDFGETDTALFGRARTTVDSNLLFVEAGVTF
ncbi:MAG: hypothetical protein AB7O97_08970 [Planctomycetota bacterium]